MSLDSLQDAYPLSKVQLGILFHSSQSTVSDDYLTHVTFKLKGKLNEDYFKSAWQDVVQHFSALRTSFEWLSLDEPLQLIHSHADFDWQAIDSSNSTLSQQQLIDHWIELERTQPFDLTAAPLVRFKLLKLSETESLFIWTIHHLIADGWSVPLLLDAVLLAYDKHASLGNINQSFVPDIPYKLFVQRQASKSVEHAMDYWQKLLANKQPTYLNVPNLSAEGTQGTDTINRHQTKLSLTESKLLKQSCAKLKITQTTAIVAAWSLVLQHMTDNTHVFFGLTATGRNTEQPPDLTQAIGLYPNTLPVSVDVKTDGSLLDWLLSLQHQVLNLGTRDHVSLSEIQPFALRNDSVPLFDTVVAIQGQEYDATFSNADNSLQITDIDCYVQSHFALSLIVTLGDTLHLTLMYAPEKIAPALAQRLLERTEHYLHAICTCEQSHAKAHLTFSRKVPPTYVSAYVNSNADEQLQDYDNVLNWFNATCKRHAMSTALITTSQSIPYSELHSRAIFLAATLSEHIVSGSLIALHIEDQVDHVVAMFASLMTGCAYLPLDPSYPTARNNAILEASNAKAVITDRKDSLNLNVNTEVLSFEHLASRSTLGHTLDECTQRLNQIPLHPTQLAYVLYTSGSSGTPKGVSITHKNLSYSTAQRNTFYQETPRCFLLLSSFSFDSSVAGLFWTLLNGGTLVLPSNEQQKSIPQLLKLIDTHKVTHSLSLPSVYQLLLESASKENLSSLRTMIVAGESLSSPVVQQHFDQLENCRLFNEYGPTEGTVWSSSHQCSKNDSRTAAIGRSLTETPIVIVDSALSLCLQGVVGEILIGGTGVAEGYHNNPSSTQDAFIQANFEGSANNRWYRTGDRGYIAEDGVLVFLGRLDTQVKIRGHRIELVEIDKAVNLHSDVLNSATVFIDSTTTQPSTLVNFFEPKPSSLETVSLAQLKASVEERLPSAFRPTKYLQIEALPTLPNGKVDRRKLEQLAKSHSVSLAPASINPPETQSEIWLSNEIVSLLGRKDFSMGDNFFKLGGDSLSAMRLIAQIHKQFDVTINFNLLTSCDTLKDLCSLFSRALHVPESHSQSGEIFESGEI